MMRIKKTFPFFTFDKSVKAGILMLENGSPVDTVEVSLPGKRWKLRADIDEKGEILALEVQKA